MYNNILKSNIFTSDEIKYLDLIMEDYRLNYYCNCAKLYLEESPRFNSKIKRLALNKTVYREVRYLMKKNIFYVYANQLASNNVSEDAIVTLVGYLIEYYDRLIIRLKGYFNDE